MLYLIVNNKAMKITADDRQFDIPSISQAVDYRYAKDPDCSCSEYEGFMEHMTIGILTDFMTCCVYA